jgi:hypothetical protein
MQIHCYLFQSTLDKPCKVHSRLDHVFAVLWYKYKEPLLGNQSVIVKPRYFYTRRCNIFDIFVKPITLLVIYLANPRDISRTITHGRWQHMVEEVCGVAMVVDASTWTLSSWFGPPNAWLSTVEGENGAQVNNI